MASLIVGALIAGLVTFAVLFPSGFGWLVWGGLLVFAVLELAGYRTAVGTGERHHPALGMAPVERGAVFPWAGLAVLLILVPTLGVSKLHLLWIVPLIGISSFALIALSGTRVWVIAPVLRMITWTAARILTLGVSPLPDILTSAAQTYVSVRNPLGLSEPGDTSHAAGLAAVRDCLLESDDSARFREVLALLPPANDPRSEFVYTVCAIYWVLTSVPSPSDRDEDVRRAVELVSQRVPVEDLKDLPGAKLDLLILQQLWKLADPPGVRTTANPSN